MQRHSNRFVAVWYCDLGIVALSLCWKLPLSLAALLRVVIHALLVKWLTIYGHVEQGGRSTSLLPPSSFDDYGWGKERTL